MCEYLRVRVDTWPGSLSPYINIKHFPKPSTDQSLQLQLENLSYTRRKLSLDAFSLDCLIQTFSVGGGGELTWSPLLWQPCWDVGAQLLVLSDC